MEENKNNEGLIKLLCYVGIFVLLIFIVLPPLFWNLFPEEENKEEEQTKKEVYLNLSCTRREDFFDYEIITSINSEYVIENGDETRLKNSTFTYEIEFNDEVFNDDTIIIEEYEELKKVDNVDFNESGNTYVLKIDYENFDYSNEPLLQNHQLKPLVNQITYYGNEHFECNTSRKD